MKKSMKQTKSVARDVAIGAGLVAVAAAVAGTYFLYGAKGASKRRRQIKAWSIKARGEVLERLEKLSEINEKIYQQIVKEVAGQYQKAKRLESKDVKEFVGELKSHWEDIAKEVRAYSKKAARTIQKARRS
jgi:hypothetical protein